MGRLICIQSVSYGAAVIRLCAYFGPDWLEPCQKITDRLGWSSWNPYDVEPEASDWRLRRSILSCNIKGYRYKHQ